MQTVKINKILVNVGGVTEISLNNNNHIRLKITNDQLGIPDFDSIGFKMTKPMYANYCKDVVINLLKNGGIQGFYYEPKQTVSRETIRYDQSTFMSTAASNTKRIVTDMIGDKFDVTTMAIHDTLDVTHRYKNGYVGFASVDVLVKISGKKFITTVEIKSGQISNPKTIKRDDGDINLNMKNILAVITE